MPNIDVPGGEVFIRDLNPEGPDPVVMIHGLLSNHTVFIGCGAIDMAKQRRVILYDLRGHGLTSIQPTDFRLDTVSQDLFNLMDALGVARADLVGYSFGAAVALKAVLNQPERSGRLALIEPYGLSRDHLPTPDPDLTVGILDYSRSTSAQVSQRRAAQLDEQLRVLYADHRLVESLAADADFFATAALDQIDAPVLVLSGKSSPYREDAELAARLLPDSEIRRVQADHNLPVTHAQWVRRKLIQWAKEGLHGDQRA